MAHRQEAQELIRHELSSLIEREDGKGTLSIEDLSHSSYSDAFIREVLRFKPDAVNATRMATKDLELGGYCIPKGVLIVAINFSTEPALI